MNKQQKLNQLAQRVTLQNMPIKKAIKIAIKHGIHELEVKEAIQIEKYEQAIFEQEKTIVYKYCNGEISWEEVVRQCEYQDFNIDEISNCIQSVQESRIEYI